MKRAFSGIFCVRQKSHSRPAFTILRRGSGFTIIELLVVITVIGILAAITIVSYTNINNKAIAASLQADLANASQQLKLFYVDNAAYPNSVTDCPTPASGNFCLKASSGNNYSSYSANNNTSPPSFSLTATNTSTSTIAVLTNDSKPIVPTASIAPLGPVADWLAIPQGDHYGNFYDSVSKSWASVTRTTAKTIYDPTTNHIYDVPAGYLAVNPRSDGKSGSEAIIEEGRTNLVPHSSFDSGLTGWGNWGSPPTREVLTNGSAYGNNSFHLVANASNQGVVQSFTSTIGTTYTASVYVKVVSGQPELMILNNGSYSGSYTPAGWAGDGKWHQLAFTFTEGAVSDTIYLGKSGGGVIGEYYFSAVQIEVGAFATSYIPTTTATVTRNADNVTVPKGSLSGSLGTFFSVSGAPVWQGVQLPASAYAHTVNNRNDGSNWLAIEASSGSPASVITGVAGWSGGNTQATGQVLHSGYHTDALIWNTGTNLAQIFDGVKTQGAAISAPTIKSTTDIGFDSYYNNKYWNGPIQRAIIYASSLSDADVTTVTNAVQNGP